MSNITINQIKDHPDDKSNHPDDKSDITTIYYDQLEDFLNVPGGAILPGKKGIKPPDNTVEIHECLTSIKNHFLIKHEVRVTSTTLIWNKVIIRRTKILCGKRQIYTYDINSLVEYLLLALRGKNKIGKYSKCNIINGLLNIQVGDFRDAKKLTSNDMLHIAYKLSAINRHLSITLLEWITLSQNEWLEFYKRELDRDFYRIQYDPLVELSSYVYIIDLGVCNVKGKYYNCIKIGESNKGQNKRIATHCNNMDFPVCRIIAAYNTENSRNLESKIKEFLNVNDQQYKLLKIDSPVCKLSYHNEVFLIRDHKHMSELLDTIETCIKQESKTITENNLKDSISIINQLRDSDVKKTKQIQQLQKKSREMDINYKKKDLVFEEKELQYKEEIKEIKEFYSAKINEMQEMLDLHKQLADAKLIEAKQASVDMYNGIIKITENTVTKGSNKLIRIINEQYQESVEQLKTEIAECENN